MTHRVQSDIVAETNLTVLDTVVVPGFSEETAWFERPRALEPSSIDSHVWAIDPSAATLTEIDTAGAVVRILGKKGEGPGELRTPATLVDTGTRILVLDRAGKVTTLTQAGTLQSEVRLESQVWDVAARGEHEFVVVPGIDGLVDVFEEGELRGGIGVALGPGDLCRSCQIAVLPDGRILVAEPSVPQLLLLSSSGTTSTVIDLRNDLMEKWLSERPSRYSKDWISEIVDTDAENALLLMSTPSPTSGTELWKVNLQTGSVVRSKLSGSFVTSAALAAGGLYALLGEFRAISVSSGGVLREGMPAIVRFARP